MGQKKQTMIDFEKQIDNFIKTIENTTWVNDFASFAADQLINAGYGAEVRNTHESFWEHFIIISNKETHKLETWFLKDTFLDIFAVDRKADPIVFDDRLNDRKFAIHKMIEILEGRMNIFAALVDGRSASEVYEDYPEKFDRIVQRRKSHG